MGWSHGARWDDERIREELTEASRRYGRMPTANELRANGQNSLACAVARGEGYAAWAKRLDLTQKGTETHWGQRWELHEKRWLESRGATVQKMPTRHPFDLAVNGARVDVKASNIPRVSQRKRQRARLHDRPDRCRADARALHRASDRGARAHGDDHAADAVRRWPLLAVP